MEHYRIWNRRILGLFRSITSYYITVQYNQISHIQHVNDEDKKKCSNFELKKDMPYSACPVKLWGIYYKHFGWVCLYYNGTKTTHWGRDKMAPIFQMTFSIAFSWMKIYEFWLRFHWSFFFRLKLTIIQHWFRKWLGTSQVTSHCLSQWWLFYLHIYVSLGLNDLKWDHGL